MKQSLILSILILIISSSPIHARNKPNLAKSPSPSLAATPAPGPSHSDCSTIIFGMLDCLSYISIGSNETKPVKSCCDGIESVLAYNPQCICFGLASSSSMGIELNKTRALAMPKTCKLSIDPHCDLSSVPGASAPGASTPSLSPDAVSPSTKTPTSSPSSAESPTTSPSSETVTAPSPSSSGTNNLSVPTLTLVASLISSLAYISAMSN
ncbi:hypothetical protein AALP_AA6G201000 [Arabis alpina]|uniref:Bifunctional inhibitor/plant lipid transfer protein/seed storage helical domain-containing protein n=1 Tax=Arabis alpina TaxID=50452 RepID=A0A087GQH0_ARAAL|nr:hypothetical protein AALP_AA6G201000 [Arabis alpina]